MLFQSYYIFNSSDQKRFCYDIYLEQLIVCLSSASIYNREYKKSVKRKFFLDAFFLEKNKSESKAVGLSQLHCKSCWGRASWVPHPFSGLSSLPAVVARLERPDSRPKSASWLESASARRRFFGLQLHFYHNLSLYSKHLNITACIIWIYADKKMELNIFRIYILGNSRVSLTSLQLYLMTGWKCN